MILAIDTCLDTFSVALVAGEVCLAEVRGGKPKSHLTQIYPALQACLAAAGVGLENVTAVAVTTGPGSFTGVRLGVLVARTLGQTRGLPLVAVDTLEALALNAPWQDVTVAVDARKSQVVWARYRVGGSGRPVVLEAPRLVAASAFVVEDGVVLGNALVRYPQPRARCLAGVQVQGAHVGRLGGLLPSVTWRELLPEYLRDADIS